MDLRVRWAATVSLACAFLLTSAGCGPAGPPNALPTDQLPPGVEVTVAPFQMRLELSNGTTIPVVLAVNGGVVSRVPPGGGENLGADALGPLPWDAVVTTASSRRLLNLVVHEGDARSGTTGNGGRSESGVGVRADLSCGRIDLWSGPPMLGPAPGPGEPGDCDP